MAQENNNFLQAFGTRSRPAGNPTSPNIGTFRGSNPLPSSQIELPNNFPPPNLPPPFVAPRRVPPIDPNVPARLKRKMTVVYRSSSRMSMVLPPPSVAPPGLSSSGNHVVGGVSEEPIMPQALAQQTNLMYSDREIDEMSSLLQFIVNRCPRILSLYYSRVKKADYDEFSRSLINISLGQDCTFDLLNFFIEDEFRSNVKEQIMRENCAASKLIKAYIRLVGSDFLQNILAEFVQRVVISDRKVGCEVDINKIDDPQDIPKNIQILQEYLDDILNTITSGVELIPPGIRIISKIVADNTTAHIGDDQIHTMIGSFLFLRFINPAIFSPELFDLLPKGKLPSPVCRRKLILITKILQNLSNGKTFSKKESYMMPFDEFVLTRRNLICSYFDAVINFETSVNTIHDDLDIMINIHDLHVFHALLFQYKDEVQSLFNNPQDAEEFNLRLEKLGSYDNKISFSFLEENHQKYVKQVAKDQEVSFVGYVDMVKKEKKKPKPVKLIVIVGMNRVIFIRGSTGKTYTQFHLLELVQIISSSPSEFELFYGDNQNIFCYTENGCDSIINSIRRSFEYSFSGMSERVKYNLHVTPSSRLDELVKSDGLTCGGLDITYSSLCDYYQNISEYKEFVTWDILNLYNKTTTFDFCKFTDKDETVSIEIYNR
eukprot:TRINITY_DN5236_c0_g1_i3.p1 TRINITY_DN5236_c0_g1~~TRINITY_DN5236_c0_g1_i3.p1  ORF type:complete len:671 (-),score=143.21 TRINITY_DN5236_c0_g1_i3:1477-3450(-)